MATFYLHQMLSYFLNQEYINQLLINWNTLLG